MGRGERGNRGFGVGLVYTLGSSVEEKKIRLSRSDMAHAYSTPLPKRRERYEKLIDLLVGEARIFFQENIDWFSRSLDAEIAIRKRPDSTKL